MLSTAQLQPDEIAALEADMDFLQQLKGKKGLVEIKDNRLKELGADGIIAVGCPDGDHSHDVFGHLCRYNTRLHLIALNGGAMLMSERNSAYSTEGTVLIKNAAAAWGMQKGKTILLLSHWPCGRARHDSVPLKDVIMHTLEADRRLTAMLGVTEEVILPLFHVDWTPTVAEPEQKRRRTYVIKNACWDLLA